MLLTTRPRKRSPLRRRLGQTLFTCRRYVSWYTKRSAFTRKKMSTSLPYLVAGHQTPLFRQLRNVDMWLQTNKVANLNLATERLNQITLCPGEIFSFWRLVGKPTSRKGYLPGMVLSDGTFYAGVGGGLCQLANLIFWDYYLYTAYCN